LYQQFLLRLPEDTPSLVLLTSCPWPLGRCHGGTWCGWRGLPGDNLGENGVFRLVGWCRPFRGTASSPEMCRRLGGLPKLIWQHRICSNAGSDSAFVIRFGWRGWLRLLVSLLWGIALT